MKIKVLVIMLTVATLICMTGFAVSAATNPTSLTFAKTGDAKVRIGYAITRTAVTTPENLTVTYTSSDIAVATVNENGKVVGKKLGNAVITASAGGLKASYNITVVKADAGTKSTKVFDGFNVTVLDKVIPAVNMQGRLNNPNIMCFISAEGKEIGSISYNDYNAIITKNKKIVQLEGGGTLGIPPDGRSSWNEWFADEFNKYRGLGAGSREETAELQNAETIEKYRRELVRLVNIEREKVGLSPYIINDECMKYSQIRAQELPTSFSHTRPDGTNAGYEIIAASSSPEGALNRWMNSPGHKAAILNENRVYVGAGVCITKNNTLYFQMYFERDPEEYANTLIFG